jgi:TRAP-type transport system periplasmic protein
MKNRTVVSGERTKHRSFREVRPTLAVSAFALLGLSVSACRESGPLELKLAHSAPPESMIAVAADEFARVANERLGGRASVIVYGAGQLGGDQAVLQKLKLGTVDFGLPSTVMSAAVPAFALFDMPYLVADRAHLRRIEEEIFWPDLAPLAEERGYRVLALWENGFRHVTNNVRPIFAPADLAGIKIRTPNSSWRVALFRALGANPSPMPFSELFMALETGVMDGQENPLTNIRNASFQEVQRYLSLTGHLYSPAYLIVGVERWGRLPVDVRAVLEAVARETQAFVFETAVEVDSRILVELQGGGMQINEVDRSLFVKPSRAVYDEFDEQVPGGRAWIERALALAPDQAQRIPDANRTP